MSWTNESHSYPLYRHVYVYVFSVPKKRTSERDALFKALLGSSGYTRLGRGGRAKGFSKGGVEVVNGMPYESLHHVFFSDVKRRYERKGDDPELVGGSSKDPDDCE